MPPVFLYPLHAPARTVSILFLIVISYFICCRKIGLYKHYAETEMGVEAALLGLELTGMGVHTQEYRDVR